MSTSQTDAHIEEIYSIGSFRTIENQQNNCNLRLLKPTKTNFEQFHFSGSLKMTNL